MNGLTWLQVSKLGISTIVKVAYVKSAGSKDPENIENVDFQGRLVGVDDTFVEIQPLDLARKTLRLRKEDFAPAGKVTVTLP